MTASEAAEWMAAQVEKNGILYQHEAASNLEDRDGDLTYIKDNGNTAIAEAVLATFKKLTAESVVWDRREICWRKREAGDGTGRQAE